MGLETGSYISDLVATNPTSADPKSQGDDHIRLLKSVLKTTFPALTGAVTVSQTILNYLTGLTSNAQNQIDSKGAHAGKTWTGTHDFTNASITASTKTLGDSSKSVATTEFVTNTAFGGVTQNPTPDFLIIAQGII